MKVSQKKCKGEEMEGESNRRKKGIKKESGL